jgi:hypothetical protein
MKIVRTLFVVAMIVMVLSVCFVSAVSALEQNQASVLTFTPETQERGESSSIRIRFTNNSTKNLDVYYVGVHFDWMDTDQLYGISYEGNPKTVAPNANLVVDIINYTVPASASLGSHEYYIGVDGYDQDENPFSWTSEEATITVINPVTTSQPTTTPTQTSQNPQPFDMNLIIYIALLAAVAVIIVLLVVVMKLKKQAAPTGAVSNVDQPKST